MFSSIHDRCMSVLRCNVIHYIILLAIVFCFLSIQILITSFSTKEPLLQLMYMKTLYSALHTPALTMVLMIFVIIDSTCFMNMMTITIIDNSHLLNTVSKQTLHFRTMLSCTSTGPGLTTRENILSHSIIIIHYGQTSLSMSIVSYQNNDNHTAIIILEPNLTLRDLARIEMLYIYIYWYLYAKPLALAKFT